MVSKSAIANSRTLGCVGSPSTAWRSTITPCARRNDCQLRAGVLLRHDVANLGLGETEIVQTVLEARRVGPLFLERVLGLEQVFGGDAVGCFLELLDLPSQVLFVNQRLDISRLQVAGRLRTHHCQHVAGSNAGADVDVNLREDAFSPRGERDVLVLIEVGAAVASDRGLHGQHSHGLDFDAGRGQRRASDRNVGGIRWYGRVGRRLSRFAPVDCCQAIVSRHLPCHHPQHQGRDEHHGNRQVARVAFDQR